MFLRGPNRLHVCDHSPSANSNASNSMEVPSAAAARPGPA